MSKAHAFLRSALIAAAAAGLGYFARDLRREGGESTLVQAPCLDSYLSEGSFSEVENAKSLLQALCWRSLYDIQVQECASLSTARMAMGGTSRPDYDRAIQMLRQAIQEFAGTGQELFLTRHLLLALEHEHLANPWLDTYLNVLYQRPTSDMVAQFAGTAVRMGNQAGRSAEVSRALQHLNAIPPGYDHKYQISRAAHEVTRASLICNDR